MWFEYHISESQTEAAIAHSVQDYAQAKLIYEQIYKKYSDLNLEKSVEGLQTLLQIAYFALVLKQYQECVDTTSKIQAVSLEKEDRLDILFKSNYYRAQAFHAMGSMPEATECMYSALEAARERVQLTNDLAAESYRKLNRQQYRDQDVSVQGNLYH